MPNMFGATTLVHQPKFFNVDTSDSGLEFINENEEVCSQTLFRYDKLKLIGESFKAMGEAKIVDYHQGLI